MIHEAWKQIYKRNTPLNATINATQAAWILVLLHHCILEDKKNKYLHFTLGWKDKFAKYQQFCVETLHFPKFHPAFHKEHEADDSDDEN